jgi:hypothetical protein
VDHTTITIDADASPFLAALSLISQAPPEVIESFIGIVKSGTQPFRLELNRNFAAGTGNLRVTLQPSDSFLEFVPTFGASNVDGSVIQQV